MVTIGTQTWMAENLNYAPSGGGYWCYDNDNTNCAKYGRLYDWAMAMDLAPSYNSALFTVSGRRQGICPVGWHLPSDAEWDTLMIAVEPSCKSSIHCAGAGMKLKSKDGWNDDGNGTDVHGFSALPGGHRIASGLSFNDVGASSDWWTTTEETYASSARRRQMVYNYENVYWGSVAKSFGFSVRCLKN